MDANKIPDITFIKTSLDFKTTMRQRKTHFIKRYNLVPKHLKNNKILNMYKRII
jgi:hypothetical protein